MKPFLLEDIRASLQGRFLTPMHKRPITGITCDSREAKANELFVAIRGEHVDGHDFIDQAVSQGASAVIVDRNLPLSETVRQSQASVLQVTDTVTALGDLARFVRKGLSHSIDVVAITGTNGKTTTRQMIHHVLSHYRRGHQSPANYNNHIGVPLTLFGIEPTDEFAVIEMGTNAPGEIARLSQIAEPDIAVITSIGPGHLQGLGTIDGVSREKASILAGLKQRGVVICTTEHPPTLERIEALRQQVISFGIDGQGDITATDIREQDGRLCFRTNDRYEITLPTLGIHNVNNALAALATVRRMGITTEQFAKAIATFELPAGRMTVREASGITILDDTYNANPASMRTALETLARYRPSGVGRRIAALGDMLELGEANDALHEQLGRNLPSLGIDIFLAVGPAMSLAANAAIEAGMPRGAVQRSINSRRLARLVKSSLRDGDIILVKGSRGMTMEKVVTSLSRYRGGRTPVLRRRRSRNRSGKQSPQPLHVG